MSPIEKQLNEAVNKAIKEAPKGLDEAGLTGWVIDKVSEEDWDKKARQLIKKDPKRFADILMYDLRKRSFSKYFYEE